MIDHFYAYYSLDGCTKYSPDKSLERSCKKSVTYINNPRERKKVMDLHLLISVIFRFGDSTKK